MSRTTSSHPYIEASDGRAAVFLARYHILAQSQVQRGHLWAGIVVWHAMEDHNALEQAQANVSDEVRSLGSFCLQ